MTDRPIGLFSLIALVVANMIGAGVFTTSGFSLGSLHARHYVLWAWAIGGAIALLGAICYGRLARAITESGGEYIFLKRNVHPLAGFLAGWVSLWAGFTGAIAFAAKGFEAYARDGHDLFAGLPSNTFAFASIWVFALLHALRLKSGLWTQNAIVVVKLILLTAFVAFGSYFVAYSPYSNFRAEELPEVTGGPSLLSLMAGALVWISLSYSGYNAAIYVAGEVNQAERNVPRAMWIATLIVIGFYLALNTIFLYGPEASLIVNQEAVASIAAGAIGGVGWQRLIQGVICLSLLSSVSSMLIAGPRVYAKMAADGLFPRWFAGSAGAATPAAAIFLQAALTSAVIAISSLQQLLDYLSLTLSISAALTVLSLFWMKPPRDATVTGEVGIRLAAFVFVIVTIFLAVMAGSLDTTKWLATAITLTSGAVVYGLIAALRSYKR